jgi:glycosyltransferase involved in cell wall biosynthesis
MVALLGVTSEPTPPLAMCRRHARVRTFAKIGNTVPPNWLLRISSMDSAALVSVIVPTRNRPHMLRKSLEAIARQNIGGIQIVVIDDGSRTDDAQANEQLTRVNFDAAAYHYLDSAGATGAGPSFARNVGITLATGRFVAFCDDDDFWTDSDHLDQCVALFEADLELDFIFANQEVRHDGKVTTPRQAPDLPLSLQLGPATDGKSFLLSKEDCLLGWFAHLNTCVFRRELLEKLNGFWGTACYEDLDLYVRAVDSARRVRYLDRTVAVHNNAGSTQREAVTTKLTQKDIWVCATNVAAHIIHTVGSKAAVRYAGHFAGEAYRRLALDANKASDRARAAAFARLALAAKFSPKWSLVTAFFNLRLWI